MKKLAGVVLGLAVIASAGTSVLAQNRITGGAMEIVPKCKLGDPVVAVDMKTKMYMLHDKMHMGSAMERPVPMHHHIRLNNMKMMCKSKADAMGARMMKASIVKKKST